MFIKGFSMKALILLFAFLLALPAFASNEMRTLVQITDGNIYGGHVPAGYRSVKLNTIAVRGGLQTFMTSTTVEKKKAWGEHVFTSGEYDRETVAERRRIAANPWATLGVKSLLEISEVYAIYKGNKLIGYFIEISDHVQAAIYQDGAWYDAFFDANLNLVEAFDRSA